MNNVETENFVARCMASKKSEIVRSMTQLQTKLFTASLPRLRTVKSSDIIMVFV